ncbi:chymotrypsin family serine protease [Streptoalloteichus hindustanus]|uniref:Trypsin n=1 Tax=Streptoalloteichus hindustanus TaxID=2017 RepID=A0A1M5I5F3_STRHI|nr:hypothetical protein [Streptoalloteichus hindustanus]SHG23309.1 hypothetical protein SAMN05444320_107106 [Streptoalloteichus hindustanus]
MLGRRTLVVALVALVALVTMPMATGGAAETVAGPVDRYNDTQPHFGGAAIGVHGSGRTICSSGFTVTTKTGQAGILTAGHCFAPNTRLASGRKANGSVNDYGTVTDRKRDATPTVPGTRDMAVITGVPGRPQTYAPSLWTDPVVPGVLRVGGRQVPTPDQDIVCFSGRTSRAVCGFRVIGNLRDGSACDPDNDKICTHGLARAVREGRGGAPGDSGSPVYWTEWDGRATIVGMVIGSLYRDNRTTIFFHTIDQIETGLGVTLVSQPDTR